MLGCINASATIVDGVRQKPTPTTTVGFSTDALGQDFYFYNVEAQVFFSQGNSWATQASVDDEGRKMRIQTATNGDYLVQQYCWRTSDQPGGYMPADWREVFFESETAMFVDHNDQANYFFTIVDNGDGTFRMSSSEYDPDFDLYAGNKFVGILTNTTSTALKPFCNPLLEECYVDWALVSVEVHDVLVGKLAIYNKAQELKAWIDKIEALNGNASTLKSVYENESSTMDELQAAIDSAFPIYLQAVVDNAPDKDNVDLTMALVNPMLEEGTTGWINGSTVTVAGLPTNKCMEAFNKASFDVYQELADMPVGVYEIEVQGFYRYKRDQDAWEAYKAQSVDYVKPEGVPVYVYLNNNSTPFKNIYSEPVTKGTLYTTDTSLLYPAALQPCEDDQGNWYPNEMYNSAMAFNAGMYKQTAYGLIANEGDDFRIGVKGSSNQAGDSWVIWDNFKLYYRGFKPEVVQPILETAMNDLNQYANMLMGKTEFAQLSQALTDAQAAITDQDGEKMFQALNALYNVKESVIASKDLFLSEDVSTNLADLQEAIAYAANEKMSAATRNAATTLEAGIRGNTRYEGTQIEQLKNDVSAAISGLQNSPVLYSQLNGAISTLEAATALKASQALLSEANTLIGTAKTGYNEGSIADSEVDEWMGTLGTKTSAIQTSATAYTNLNNAITSLQTAAQKKAAKTLLDQASEKLTQAQEGYQAGSLSDEAAETLTSSMNTLVENINASATLYASLNAAIVRLQTAINDASAAQAHVSAATLDRAQQRLTHTEGVYNAGSIADDQIEARIGIIDGLIDDLTHSLYLYENFNTALVALNTKLGDVAETKLSATVRSNAQSLYDTDTEAYNEGSITDENIEAEIAKLNNAATALTNSATTYATMVEPLQTLDTKLKGVAETKLNAEVRSNAQTLYTTDLAAYNDGTIEDGLVAAEVTKLNAATTSLTSSAAAYATLGGAIPALQAVVTKKAAKSVLDGATALLTEVQAAYNEGTIADDAIEAKVTEMQTAEGNVEASATLYASLNAAIVRLQTAINDASAAQAHVSAATLDRAQQRLTHTEGVYNAGSIADDQIEARIGIIDGLIDDLTHSLYLYENFNTALVALNTKLGDVAETKLSATVRSNAQSLYDTDTEAYNEGSITDENIEAEIAKLNNAVTALTTSATTYATMVEPLADLETALQQKAAQSVIGTATTVFNDASAAYTDGSIADADVASTITSINAQTSALNTSAGQYAQLNTALGNFQTAITAAQEAGASVTMITNANSLKAGYQSGYDNGSEENVPAALTAISNAIANLGAAAPLYPQASDLTADLTTLGTKLDEADEAIAVAEDVLAQYISSDLREELESEVAEYKETVAAAKTDKGTMESQLAGRQHDLTNSESALTEDNAALYSAIGADFNTMSGDIAALIRSLSGIKTTLDEKTENAVEESANKVEIAHNIATFCSMMDLDFTDEEKVRAYIVSAFTPSTGDAILTRVYDVPAGTGVVLIGDNGSYEITPGTGATVVSNLLVGVNRATELHQVDGDYTNFILTNGESGEGFYPVEDGSKLAAGKAYLPLPTASLPASGIGNGAAIRFVFEDSGEATFIDSVGFDYAGSKMEKGVYYNLNGQRVGRPVTGGIYILDGKKVYVK